MARVVLTIDDPAHRLTLKAMLEAAGHQIAEDNPDVRILDVGAGAGPGDAPTLVLTTAADVPDAVRAMERGAYGYILLPLQPGEAPLKVSRAANQSSAGAVGDDGIKTLEEVEHAHILDTLRRCKHNQAKAARVLGIGRNTLWRKLKRIREQDDHGA